MNCWVKLGAARLADNLFLRERAPAGFWRKLVRLAGLEPALILFSDVPSLLIVAFLGG
jgi:hypothetical protein